MPLRIVVGLGWGDEGKGKVVDHLASDAQAVARFSGGANAGHTVKAEGRSVVLHQIPTGMLREGVTGLIGAGCVVDPVALLEEMEGLASLGFPIDGRLFVSSSAHLVHPVYRTIDESEETLRGSSAIGTTGRGIGPAYVRKYARRGIRLEDASDISLIAAMSSNILEELSGSGSVDEEASGKAEDFLQAAVRVNRMSADTGRMIDGMLSAGETVIAEGAQGTLLDPDHGTYPFVTSGSCTAASAFTSFGIGPRQAEVAGVMKAYSTRVGAGPFPTELLDSTGDELRTKGHEFGATTGRPRRCGWLDAVLMKYSVAVNGCSWIAITLLDVLGGQPSIKVCTSYRGYPEGCAGRPFSAGRGLSGCEPVFETLTGWSEDIRGERSWNSLPGAARRYVEFLESFCGAPIRMVSTGPDREDTIWREA